MMDEVLGGRTDEESQSFSSFILSPSFFPRVPLAVPYWSGATYRSILRCLISGHIIDGSELGKLRSQVIETLGVADAVMCGSGSLALELALRTCGIRDGDEVVIPTFCCSAVVPPILAVGATPVLADVGEELNLTVETVEPVLTRKTRAIIVPHLFGNPGDIEGIAELAARKNICVIDDAAQALGASIDGRPVGSFGDAGIVSFGNEKICSGIGGGAVVSHDERFLTGGLRWELAQPGLVPTLQILLSTLIRRWKAPLLKRTSRVDKIDPHTMPIPYEYESMTNLNAAVAMSLLQTLHKNITARRERIRVYQELLGDEERLALMRHRPGSACLTQIVRILPGGRGRDVASEIIEALAVDGYEIHGSYVPIHLLGNSLRFVWDCLPHSTRVWPDLIELPCGPNVGLDQVEQIAAIVKATINP